MPPLVLIVIILLVSLLLPIFGYFLVKTIGYFLNGSSKVIQYLTGIESVYTAIYLTVALVIFVLLFFSYLESRIPTRRKNTLDSPSHPKKPTVMLDESQNLFPISIVSGTRGYIKKIAHQANGCYREGWYDACAVMVRRLIEILIVDSFDAQNRISDITKVNYISPISRSSTQPTASEIRRFLGEDFRRLEDALNDVWFSINQRSRLPGYSATSNWEAITSLSVDIPEVLNTEFEEVIEMRELARGGAKELTGELTSAKKGINRILGFLHQQFPKAGIEPLVSGGLLPLRELIEKYLEAEGTYWHIERNAKPALKKIKELGDLGAHGRYVNVTKQSLEKYQDNLIIGIQQLVGTAHEDSRSKSK